MFEGKWGCGSKCIRALVAAAIRREAVDVSAPLDERAHRYRLPLGLILVNLGWISPAQLSHALALHERDRTKPVGHWLIEWCGVEKSLVTRALAMQRGCPVLTMDGFDAEAMALVVPKLLMETYGIVPVRSASARRLYIGFADRPDVAAAFAVERMCCIKAEPGIVEAAALGSARVRLSECDFVNAALDDAEDRETLVRKVSSMVIGMQPRASRLVRMHHFYWLRMWLEQGAMTSRDGGVPCTREDVVDRLYVFERSTVNGL